jgi:transposase InsO family protein
MLAGKPNQNIPKAPLKPIPVVDEPFSKIIMDCVGRLPKTKAGNEYLLTIMCTSTRFPEAFPLRNIKARTVVKAMTRFFTTFGLPRIVQTDQGSNFTSHHFQEALAKLGISHVVSSAYHPQSQGALERFHQTMKTMLRTFVRSNTQWDETVPWVIFAARSL